MAEGEQATETPTSAPAVVSIQVGCPRVVTQPETGAPVSTAIFKEPIEGRVMLRRLNFDGDEQADLTVHGGALKAVYVYPVEYYDFWRRELPQVTLQNGMFGENLTIRGISEAGAQIGDRYRIGEAEAMVRQPRLPCYKLAIRFNRPDMLKRFLASRRTGWYLSVTKEGEVGAGDAIERIGGDPDAITIADVVELYVRDRGNVDLLRRAVATPALPEDWRRRFTERLEQLGARS